MIEHRYMGVMLEQLMSFGISKLGIGGNQLKLFSTTIYT